MIHKSSTIIFLFLLSVISIFLYLHYQLPEGITPKSDSIDEKIALYALVTSIFTFLTALIGLIIKLIKK